MRKDRMMRGGAAGMNLQGQQEAVDDLRQHIEIGRVRGDGGDSHFEVTDGDVWVDCVIMPTEQPVTCRLSTVAGGPGNGIWMVPPEDAEVVIAFPSGQIEAGGIILAVLSSQDVPSGIAEGQVVIVSPKTLIYQTSEGDAQPLPTLEEFRNHTHSSGMGPTGVVIDPIPSVGTIAGTKVLKAE